MKEDRRYKARLVAQGFTQTYSVDYFETYAPVARFASIRFILALAAKFKLHLQQIDVDTAFLTGILDEEVYIELLSIPDGYLETESGDSKNLDLVAYLLRGLYGLK